MNIAWVASTGNVAVRATHLKTFEIPFRKGRKKVTCLDETTGSMHPLVMCSGTGVMTAMNLIGTVPAGPHLGIGGPLK